MERKDVSIGDVVSALHRLRTESAGETEGPDLRTSVMTHLAWVPPEWHEAAVETLAGLGDRHPSRGILLFPVPSADDGIDARVSVLAFPLAEQRRHAAEVIELRLRGRRTEAPASIVKPSARLRASGVPALARPSPFGAPELEQLLDVCDRFVVDSVNGPTCPRLQRAALHSRRMLDIAWRRTEPWRRELAGLWPGIGEVRELNVTGPVAEASLLVGLARVARPPRSN